ncbi:MAG: TldD/PmbA family protein [Candidatus Thorarchaeota archaeon]
MQSECTSHISYIRFEKLQCNSKAILMEDLAQTAIEAALNTGVSFADVRIENSTTTIIELNDGITRQSMASRMKGAGIRAFIDGAWAFAQTTNLTPAGMRTTAESVAKLALATREQVAVKFSIDGPTYVAKVNLKVKKPFEDVSIEEKMGFVQMIDDQAREFDERIVSTRTIYGELTSEIHIANSLGTRVTLQNAIPRIISVPTAKEGNNRQRFQQSLSLRSGFEQMESEDAQNIGTKAAKYAIELLSSKVAVGGIYDVVLDPALNGVVTHEAFGHATEADNWPAHATVLENLIGEEVGPNYLSISDDPTLEGMRGSTEYDWEGTKTKKRLLVKDGVLTDLLHSLETSSRLEMEPNGAARAQSFMHMPQPRMSNTFMEPGDWGFDEMIEDTKHGVLLCSFNYGYTQSAKGQFMFQASHGYMIENGEKGQMVREVSLAGNILEVLAKVDAIGKDFELEGGTCGKDGQNIPTMTGGPHARIRQLPVGGV